MPLQALALVYLVSTDSAILSPCRSVFVFLLTFQISFKMSAVLNIKDLCCKINENDRANM